MNAKPGDKPFCGMTAQPDLPACGAIEATPFGNELIEDFAERALINEKLGKHSGTDILARVAGQAADRRRLGCLGKTPAPR